MIVGMPFNNHCWFKKRQSTGGFQGTKQKVQMGVMSTSEKNSTGHSITPHPDTALLLFLCTEMGIESRVWGGRTRLPSEKGTMQAGAEHQHAHILGADLRRGRLPDIPTRIGSGRDGRRPPLVHLLHFSVILLRSSSS